MRLVKNVKKQFPVLLLITLCSLCCKAQVLVTLSPEKINLPDAFKLRILIQNSGTEIIRLPLKENILIGYKQDDQSDGYFEVRELADTSEVIINPTADYQSFNFKNKFQRLELEQGDSISLCFNITSFYLLKKERKYKLRIVLKLSKYNTSKDEYSDWLFIN